MKLLFSLLFSDLGDPDQGDGELAVAQDELDDVLEGEIHLDVVGFCMSDWMPKCVDLGEAIQTRGEKREERVKGGGGRGNLL